MEKWIQSKKMKILMIIFYYIKSAASDLDHILKTLAIQRMYDFDIYLVTQQ